MFSLLAVASASYGVWWAELLMPLHEWLQLVFILRETEKPQIDKAIGNITLSSVS